MSVRTRFAPSPTGFLHIGGARTALFCYLFARKSGGQFVLRIEDTDRQRSTEPSVQAILDGMDWLGLDYDEGPVFQSGRFDRYREVVDGLLDAGKAYRCYCSRERLEELREEQRAKGVKPRYDGHCRNLDAPPENAPDPVIRLKTPLDGVVVFDDLVKGRIAVDNQELDDFVMVRSDGTPTYNFTVVVDDLDMDISHVIRGDDHVNNTPRQINLYRALDAEPPEFAHLPMILGDDGERLSKRHGAISVMKYREEGFLADALVNYLVRLGWSHGDQEVFTREEMVELFELSDVNRAPARFNPEKLLWLNQHYLQNGSEDRVVPEIEYHLRDRGLDPADGPSVADAWRLLRERAETAVDLADQADFLYRELVEYDDHAAHKQLRPAAEEPLRKLRESLSELEDWSPESIQSTIQGVVDALGVGFGKVGQPLRVAVSGRGAAPSNDRMLAVIGKAGTLERIDRALAYIERRKAEAQ